MVSSALAEYFTTSGVTISGFASRWGINRTMLHKYLRAKAAPSMEVLGKLVRVPDLKLTVFDKRLKPEDFPEKPPSILTSGIQLDLPLDEPLTVALGEQRLTLTRRTEGRIEITLDAITAA